MNEHCPNCGCDLEKERKKRKIQEYVDANSEDLKWPRIRARGLWAIGGVAFGLLISFCLLISYAGVLIEMDIHPTTLLGEDGSLFQLTLSQLILRILPVAMTLAPPILVARIWSKDIIPKEERLLRKQAEKELLKEQT